MTIDASVWINAESPAEASHASSRALIDQLMRRRAQVIAPTLLAAEVAGTISRVRGDAVIAADMARALLALPLIRWIPLDEKLALRSAELAALHRLRGADSVYAAVAVEHGCDLVSLDHEHLTRLTKVVHAITPAAALALI